MANQRCAVAGSKIARKQNPPKTQNPIQPIRHGSGQGKKLKKSLSQ
jgi:hypothetical protein